MVIGIPRETHHHENRVGLTPFAVSRLVQEGHTVLVESRAGDAAQFSDLRFEQAGGTVVFDPDELRGRSELICRVEALSSGELETLKPRSVVCAFHHLAVASHETIARLMELEATLIGYEVIRNLRGELPVLYSFSEMAGQMAVHIGNYYLQNTTGGRGILMGTVPGVPPPTVLILGAGTVGTAAARQALANGAHVIVLDASLRKLERLNGKLGGQAVTVTAAVRRLERYTSIADLVIGAILIPGERSPFLITEEMVRAMKPGSVIIDVSITQGGCVETSRPTTLAHPTFTVHDVVHYCVPNMTSNVARTASRALANAMLPYVAEIASKGLEVALRENQELASGVYLYRGKMVHAKAAQTLGFDAVPLSETLRR